MGKMMREVGIKYVRVGSEKGVAYVMVQLPHSDLAWLILEALGSEVSVLLPSLTPTSVGQLHHIHCL